MQHRALMFGLLGAVFIYGALQPTVHLIASILAITSMVCFIVLVGFDNPEPKLHKVVLIDVAVLVLLVAGLLWEWLKRS